MRDDTVEALRVWGYEGILRDANEGLDSLAQPSIQKTKPISAVAVVGKAPSTASLLLNLS